MEYQFKGSPTPWRVISRCENNPNSSIPYGIEWVVPNSAAVLPIADICRAHINEDKFRNEANAHLIAAAPELLQACIDALATVSDNGHPDGETAYALRQAIHKALNIN